MSFWMWARIRAPALLTAALPTSRLPTLMHPTSTTLPHAGCVDSSRTPIRCAMTKCVASPPTSRARRLPTDLPVRPSVLGG